MGYLGLFIQDQDEFDRNTAAVDKRIAPGLLAQTKANADLVAAYMRRNYLVGDLVNASAENIYRSFMALRDLLDWKVEPKKASTKMFQMDSESINHNRDRRTEIEKKIKSADAISKARDETEASTIITSAYSLAANVVRAPHSKTYALRDSLKAIIDAALKQTPNPTPARAKEIVAAVSAKERSTY